MNTFRCLLLALPLAMSAAAAPSIRFGLTNVTPHQVLEFKALMTATAKYEASRAGVPKVVHARGAIAVPLGFTPAKSCPILLISTSSGDSPIRAMPGYLETALLDGWVVLAAEGPPVKLEKDTHSFNQAMVASVVAHVHNCWPLSKQWPVIAAGFSGGAKRSGVVAAALLKDRVRIAGMYMAGCNEDFATTGLRLYQPGDRFKAVPIFLSNGATDPIAGPPQQAQVMASLQREGFSNIRAEVFKGSHHLDNEHLATALKWFKQQIPPDRQAGL